MTNYPQVVQWTWVEMTEADLVARQGDLINLVDEAVNMTTLDISDQTGYESVTMSF